MLGSGSTRCQKTVVSRWCGRATRNKVAKAAATLTLDGGQGEKRLAGLSCSYSIFNYVDGQTRMLAQEELNGRGPRDWSVGRRRCDLAYAGCRTKAR